MDEKEQIREKLDIVSFINEFVTLKKAGRNFTANCPFHSEKTPSFMVSPERQRWHCFGCHKSGDVFSFLMEYEHVEFGEALRLLAKRTGVTLTGFGSDSPTASKKELMYTLNKLAAEYYHYVLTKHAAGKQALSYLKGRGVSEKIIESFRLGFAPNSRTALTDYLTKKKKYAREDLLEAGLVTDLGREMIDFFRGRVMFPLYDHRDNILGFSGRTMDTTGSVKAKYINTRETLIYHKGEMFYGLQLTKDAIHKAGQAIVVEGEFDVISCFMNGVGNVVGVKGTALTEKQVTLLSRYAPKVSMCFDGDRAGKNAIKRSLPILEKHALQMSVIVIPGGKDPDEALRTDAGGFKQAVKHDIGIYDYLLAEAITEHDRRSAAGKSRIAAELLPIFGAIKNEIIKEHYLKKLSQELDTTYESLLKEVGKLATPATPSPVSLASQEKLSREELLESYLLSLIVQAASPYAACELAFTYLAEAMVPEEAQQKVLAALREYLKDHTELSVKAFAASLSAELVPTFDKAVLFPLTAFPTADAYQKEIARTARQLRELYLKKRIKQLGEQLKTQEKQGEGKASEHIREQFAQLVSLLEK
jgi:DNA primase